MTIEELLQCDAATLEKMTNDELTAHFKKYFPITRPDMAVKPSTNKPTQSVNPALAKGIALLKAHGIEDLPMFSAKLKRTK